MTTINGLVFFDLDGTLLNERSSVDPDVAQAVHDLRLNNIMPIIATGRPNSEIQPILAATGINSVISMNGQYVQFDGKEVFSSLISQDICAKLLSKTQENLHELGFYNHLKRRVTKTTPVVEKCYRYIHASLPAEDPAMYLNEPVNMMLILSEDLNKDEDYYSTFPELTFFRNGPHSIDVITKNGSKGVGVTELIRALNFEDLPTYAFGDGLNDIDLLEACQTKIAMGNALPQLKEHATYITSANTDGGIRKALKLFNLID